MMSFDPYVLLLVPILNTVVPYINVIFNKIWTFISELIQDKFFVNVVIPSNLLMYVNIKKLLLNSYHNSHLNGTNVLDITENSRHWIKSSYFINDNHTFIKDYYPYRFQGKVIYIYFPNNEITSEWIVKSKAFRRNDKYELCILYVFNRFKSVSNTFFKDFFKHIESTVMNYQEKFSLYTLQYHVGNLFQNVQLTKDRQDKLYLDPSIYYQIDTVFRKLFQHDIYDRKLNLMLTGYPGTGKSSLIMSIAKQYKFTTFIFDLDMPTLTENSVLQFLSQDWYTNKLIICEDIDEKQIFNHDMNYNTEFKISVDSKSIKKKLSLDDSDSGTKFSLSSLMNILSGVYHFPNVVWIFTTNNPEKLPKKFLRSGRIDHVFEINIPNIDTLKTFMYEYDGFADNTEDIDSERNELKIVEILTILKKKNSNLTIADLKSMLYSCNTLSEFYASIVNN